MTFFNFFFHEHRKECSSFLSLQTSLIYDSLHVCYIMLNWISFRSLGGQRPLLTSPIGSRGTRTPSTKGSTESSRSSLKPSPTADSQGLRSRNDVEVITLFYVEMKNGIERKKEGKRKEKGRKKEGKMKTRMEKWWIDRKGVWYLKELLACSFSFLFSFMSTQQRCSQMFLIRFLITKSTPL